MIRPKILALAAVLGYASFLLAGPNSQWRVLPSPQSGVANYLFGVAGLSRTNLWAVGYSYDANNRQLTLVEHWNGHAWAIVPSPNPGNENRCGSGYSGNQLNAVASVAPNDVWAVGYACGYESRTLVEHWNGKKWSVVASPNQPGAETSALAGVVAISDTDVWAVGNYQLEGQYLWNTLVEHWDGTSWSIVNSPNINGADMNFLNGVAAVSATDIWAVGYHESSELPPYQLPLIEHYDGQQWEVVASPAPPPSEYNALYGVVALAADNVWAVGYENEDTQGENGTGLIEHWDGSQWNLVSNPVAGEANDLLSVAGGSENDIWAVGYVSDADVQFSPITEHWDGQTWTVVRPPDPGVNGQLFGVVPVAGRFCAVGAYSTIHNPGYLEDPMTMIIAR
ncbi:MAG: hypothetical protein ACRD3L_15740 [Terriglobales bacterium]